MPLLMFVLKAISYNTKQLATDHKPNDSMTWEVKTLPAAFTSSSWCIGNDKKPSFIKTTGPLSCYNNAFAENLAAIYG